MNTPISRTLTFSGIIACLFVCMLGTAAAAKEKPPQSWDGLERTKVKGLDNVYVRPNVQFAPYKSVQLDETQVEFQKNWQKSFSFSNQPSASDMQKIKTKVAELMHEAFTEELVKHGYTIVDTPAEDTLQVRTAIIDLFINAPDLGNPGISKSYTTSSGAMTLVLEARDGPTGQLLARVVDGRADESVGGRMQWTNSVTNTVAARKIMDDWATRLRQSLDKLNGREAK